MGSTGNDNDGNAEDFDAIFEMMIEREHRLESEAKQAKSAANDANEHPPGFTLDSDLPYGRPKIVVSPSLRASPSPPRSRGVPTSEFLPVARGTGASDDSDLEALEDDEVPEGAIRSEELAEPDLELDQDVPRGSRSRSRTPPPHGAIQESDLEEPFLPSREPGAQPEAETNLVAAEPFEVALPETVAMAFALMDLPVTASLPDVHRKWRQWALTSHPDKVAPGEGPEHDAAARRFTALQEAKALVISWLSGAIHVANETLLGESDAEDEDNLSDADQDACDGNLEDVDPDSKHAIGLKGNPDDWEEYISPDGEEDIERTGDRREGTLMDVNCTTLGMVDMGPGEIITSDNVLDQAAALSNHMKQIESMKQYRERRCGECLERVPLPGRDLCRQCQRDEDRMSRFLERSV